MQINFLQFNEQALAVFRVLVLRLHKQLAMEQLLAPKISSIKIADGQVVCETERLEKATDAISQTGKAIYHWLTGMSELNEWSFWIDGYPELNHFLGEALNEMIERGSLGIAMEMVFHYPKVSLENFSLATASSSLTTDYTTVVKRFPDKYVINDFRIYWTELWKRFDISLSAFEVEIPPYANQFIPDHPLLIMMPKGVSLNQLKKISESLFPCSFIHENLDLEVSVNARMPNRDSYAVWAKNKVEADVEYHPMNGFRIRSMTLGERLTMGIEYFLRSGGGKLDTLDWTICNGSALQDGRVLVIGYESNVVRVKAIKATDLRDKGFRSRAVIAL